MLCEKCFSEIAEGAAFCKECGHPVNKLTDTGTGEAGMPAPVSASAPSMPYVPASFAEPVRQAVSQPVLTPAPQPILAPAMPSSAPIRSYAAPQPVFASAPAAYMGVSSTIDEGDYYHFDASETPDFEAMRGISIALIILSVCTVIGILFPMPVAIASLVMSCGGIGERDQRRALDKFHTCRVLVIIAVVTLLLFFLAGLIIALSLGYFADLMELEGTAKESLNLF
ncbi:MAG: hypothetical protein IK020_09480 [Clostridiales bacterium]|nr:hypothetical protein [Clostridiales bacterium]